MSEQKPFSQPSIEARILVSWIDANDRQQTKGSFLTSISLSWPDVLHHLPLKPGVGMNRATFLKMLGAAVAARFKPTINARAVGRVIRISGKIDAESFDQIVKTLEAEELIEPTESPKYVKQRSQYWKLTATGMRLVTEIRNAGSSIQLR